MILYVNACVREKSKTDELAKYLLGLIGKPFVERKLSEESLMSLTDERLKLRTELIAKGDYSNPMFDYAKEFAMADTIVISAPYWDLSFPTILKEYIENIYITGIVSQYGDNGMPIGLCNANKLYYVTTSGGPYEPPYSFDYIRELCIKYFGIKGVKLIKAEMLDILGNDPEEIIQKAKEQLRL